MIKVTGAKVGPFPAGEYYVGDPCYAVDDQDRWMKWLEDAGCENPVPKILLAKLTVLPEYDPRAEVPLPAPKTDAMYAVGIGTAHGDGCYTGSDGFEYGVDAGMIGCVPVECAENNALYAMRLANFTEPFYCSWSEKNGTITISNIVIETDTWGGQ